MDDALTRLAERTDVLNARCLDISKKRVDAISTPIFGRSLMIDPLAYSWECLMKSDHNSVKDGKVVMCPIAKAIPGYVYQRVVNNRMGSLVQDIRVPIIGGKIPFVYLIYERIKNRFFGGTVYVEMAETLDVLSSEEVKNLIHFCGEFGLDYGELDVLRDGEDGFLYVLDANNTPTGPCRLLTKRERHDALSTLAETFDKVFLSGVRPDVRSSEIGLIEGITAINEKKGGDSFTSNPNTALQSQRMPSQSRCGANKLQSRIGTCFALTRQSRGRGNSSRTKMNRLISFPVFLFLSLAALFLFSSWLGYSSKPRAMVESAKAIEPPAVQKAILINPNAVGQFTDPPGIKAPVVDQRVDFYVDTPLKEVMRKLSVVPSYPKDHVHSRFDVKTRHEARPTANRATRRSNSQPRDFFPELEHQFAAFVSRLRFTSATGRFVHKDVLVAQTNGRWRKKMPINERRIRTWLTSSSRPVRSN